MKMKLLITVLLFAYGCKTQKANWQSIDFGAFKLEAPEHWKKFTVQGIDSYIGGVTNGQDSLWFDYGWYSPQLEMNSDPAYNYQQDTINGLVAYIQVPKVDGNGSVRLSIPHVNDKDKFHMQGRDFAGSDTVLQIFRSLVFKERDSTGNDK